MAVLSGLLVYRRDIAKDVFGTDDPEAIGEKTKDWDTLKATAANLRQRDTTHSLLTLIHSVYMETQSTTHGYSLEQMRL